MLVSLPKRFKRLDAVRGGLFIHLRAFRLMGGE